MFGWRSCQNVTAPPKAVLASPPRFGTRIGTLDLMDKVNGLLVALLVLVFVYIHPAGARQTLQAGSCPLQPQETQLNFTGLLNGCSATADACNTCVCAVNEAFLPAFRAAGVNYDPETFDVNSTNEILYACSVQFAGQLIAANVNIQRMAGLETNCQAGVVPDCLRPILRQLSTASNETASGNATSLSTSVSTSTAGNTPAATPDSSSNAANASATAPQRSNARAPGGNLAVVAVCMLALAAYAVSDARLMLLL